MLFFSGLITSSNALVLVVLERHVAAGTSGRWDDERFVVSLDFQIPSDFVSFNFGGGWLTGWDARHTQGITWQTHGLSRGSALVWGFSSEGRVTEDWRSSTLVSSTVLTPLEKGQEEVEFLFFKNSILRFLSLFMAEGLSFFSLAEAQVSCPRFPERWWRSQTKLW